MEVMDSLRKKVRWVFDYGDEEDTTSVVDSSEDEDDDVEDDQADEQDKRKSASSKTPPPTQEKKPVSPKHASKRSSIRGGAKGATVSAATKRVSWRDRVLSKGTAKDTAARSSTGNNRQQQQQQRSSAGKRTSWKRLSFSKARTTNNNPEKVSERVLSNLGAIDEDGEYKQAKLEDSNIAGIGSEEDMALRHSAAKKEKHFKNAGKKPGIQVWRVENKRSKKDTPLFGVNKWPKEDYGSFYTGDSYIVLNTYHPVDPQTRKKNTNKLAWDIHFWLGAESSQDEIGVAAYKTVELDALLNDAAVQHRETQYHESKLFLSYFKEFKYWQGGIESGFRKVRPEKYDPRLLMVRHTNRVTKAFEIPCRAENMNHGDCFILDTGNVVYRWMGEESNFFEKNKSGLLQHNIVASRNGKAVKADPDEYFWSVLQGTEADIRDSEHPFKLQVHDKERLNANEIKLWRISDATGSLEFSMEAEGKVPMRMLDSNDVFLVHANIGIWIWLGAASTKREKSSSMAIADHYIKEHGLPNTMTVTAIPEQQANTNSLFHGLFKGK